MKYLLALTICLVSNLAYAVDADYLQEISVTISTDRGQGSGIIFKRENTTYVWTAAHVVESLRSTRQVVDDSGNSRTKVEFDDATVSKYFIIDGRTVGKIEIDAEVICYSNIEYGEDLAILKLRKNIGDRGVEFYTNDVIPEIGSDVFHVGSLLGEVGSNSMTTGILSQQGRVIDKKVYDQASCASFPGSSGGGVFNDDNELIGMVVRGAGEGFVLIVPVRRMVEWADRAKAAWSYDPEVPVNDISLEVE